MSDKNFFFIAIGFIIFGVLVFIVTSAVIGVDRQFYTSKGLYVFLSALVGVALAYPIHRFIQNQEYKRRSEENEE